MLITTIGDLKRAIDAMQIETGLTDRSPVVVGVQTRTRAGADDYPQIWEVGTTYGGDTLCLRVMLAKGFYIAKRP